MANTRVLISGASVAGPTLAFFLHRDGHDVTVVERAPQPRESGYAVDFRGAAFDVLDELGILEEVRRHETGMRGITLVDETGAEDGQLPSEEFTGELEVPKRELTRILYRITAESVEYRFGESITTLTQHDSGVTVEFERAAPRDYDLVIGADGVYSMVRRLAFDPGPGALHHLGLSGAGFSTENYLGLDHRGLLQQLRNAAVYVFSADDAERLTVSLSFATASPVLDRCCRNEQEQAVRSAFTGHSWETPRLLDAMTRAEDFFFASLCQVHLDRWSRGRAALVGDAGYCSAPTSGMGTSQALVGAGTLARQLAEADGHHEVAFAAYEAELRPYVLRNQENGRQTAAMFGAGDQ